MKPESQSETFFSRANILRRREALTPAKHSDFLLRD